MCGICLVIRKDRGITSSADLLKRVQVEDSHQWRELLSNRGPDIKGSHHLRLCHDENADVSINAAFYGFVLHLRGVPTTQPIVDEIGNILLWNGEIFGGGVQVHKNQNDGKELLQKLSSIDTCNNDDVIEIFQHIHGPWAFVYWQSNQKKLWFGRDFFGRRSLLWHLPKSSSESFVLASTVQKKDEMDFTEIPAKMIYCIKAEALSSAWPSVDEIPNSNETSIETCVTAFPINLPKPDFKADIFDVEDIKFLCLERTKISRTEQDYLSNYKKLQEKLNSFDECVFLKKEGNEVLNYCSSKNFMDGHVLKTFSEAGYPVQTRTEKGVHGASKTSDIVNNDGIKHGSWNKDSNGKKTEETGSQILKHSDGRVLNGGDIVEKTASLVLEYPTSSENEKIDTDRQEMEPPNSETEIYKQLLDYYAAYFMRFLENATMRRVFNLPRENCVCCTEIDNDICAKSKDVDQQKCSGCPSCLASNGAKIGLLFSGGIDSMVLAAMADRCVPNDESIDLLNVAFEQQTVRKETKNRNRRNETETRKDPYEVPDRISGRAGVKELNKRRKWNFIEINVTLEEVKAARTERVRHLVYPLETVLDDSLGCAIWFAAKGTGTRYALENDELVEVEDSYNCKSKVLLAGMGADEQLGGYARHRSKFEKFGWEGLKEEIEMEIQRISSRNLGRDDRCISDHGREARFPFLDENVVSFLQQVPVWIKCDPRLPRGYGEKRLLREVARRLGLHGSAVLPKRAIQFGSKIAKMENSKEKGSDSCHRLKSDEK